MSSPLAIAAVTAVIRDLLNNGLIDHDITGATGGNVTVSARPPDRVFPGSLPETDQLNLFMHQVTPNTGWTNTQLPSRDQQGRRLTNPPLALDLHYLLTAYGGSDLHAEILLGYAMQVLHDTPILTPAMIERALGAPEPLNGSILPPALQAVSASDLANQLERIRISPNQLGTEEMSKLWASMQTSYRPTAAYQVSVVLIEAQRPSRTPVPVLSRGPVLQRGAEIDPPAGRERGPVVVATLVPPFPTVETAAPPNQQVSVRMGETLALAGHHLEAPDVLARFTHSRSLDALDVPALAAPAATAAGFSVGVPPVPAAVGPGNPNDPENWRIGVYSVSALLRGLGPDDLLSNTVPVVLAPTLTVPIAAPVVDGALGTSTFTVQCSPVVWRGQHVLLIIGSYSVVAEPIAVDKTDTLTFVAQTDDLPTGSQPVRLQVDGVASILVDRSTDPPAFDPTQEIVL